MSTTTATSNMNLQLPIPTVTLGPSWAIDINAAFTVVDAHDHSAGNGVQVTPAGLNISSDLSFGSNDATLLRSTRYVSQSATLSTASDIGCLYVVGNELYYNDYTGGHKIPITSNGSVTGSTGTITGLPSGTAGAAYDPGGVVPPDGTFIFTQATGVAANIDAGTYILRYPGGYPTPTGNYIAFQAPSTLATGFAFTWPNALPGSSGAFITSSTTGVLSYTNVDNTTLSISSSTIQIPSDVNLPGSGVQVNSKRVVTANTNAAANLAIIRCYFGGTGTLLSGEGATCVQNSPGQYTVTFTTAFADTPAVVATMEDTGTPRICTVNTISSTACNVFIYNVGGGTSQTQFMFIAIGQRA